MSHKPSVRVDPFPTGHVTQAFSARQAMKNKDNGLNTPIPSRNALENLSLNRNGESGLPSTEIVPA